MFWFCNIWNDFTSKKNSSSGRIRKKLIKTNFKLNYVDFSHIRSIYIQTGKILSFMFFNIKSWKKPGRKLFCPTVTVIKNTLQKNTVDKQAVWCKIRKFSKLIYTGCSEAECLFLDGLKCQKNEIYITNQSCFIIKTVHHFIL